MLVINIPEGERFNEDTGKFEKTSGCTLKLEHSLLSLYKWESKHHVHFLENKKLTNDDIIDYIKCMSINQVDDKYYSYLTSSNLLEIKDYISDPMTATTFYNPYEKNNGGQSEIQTAECIYSAMFMLGIPLEFEKRHLNHLLTLIKVCAEKQNPDSGKSKINPNDVMRHYSEINKSRKAKMKANVKGH